MLSRRDAVLTELKDEINQWSGLLTDASVDLRKIVTPEKIGIDMVNVAGANVPAYESCSFGEIEIDFYDTPFWIDQGIEKLRKMVSLMAEVETVKTRIRILEKELRITTQRVNLFEKVKIPECQEKIRKIGIYLGDQQANAVGVSKVAKKKVQQRDEAA